MGRWGRGWILLGLLQAITYSALLFIGASLFCMSSYIGYNMLPTAYRYLIDKIIILSAPLYDVHKRVHHKPKIDNVKIMCVFSLVYLVLNIKLY